MGNNAVKQEPGDKDLAVLLDGLDYQAEGQVQGRCIGSVTSDSRQVVPGSLFVAVRGGLADGHDFVEEARALGCVAMVVEQDYFASALAGSRHSGSSWIVVKDSRQALGQIAASFYGHPAREMKLVGITGTNGKTTSSYLLESMVQESGGKPGVIGTVNYRFGSTKLPASLTTPGPMLLQSLLRRMADAGVTHAIMEVSSHALSQQRLSGLAFDVALFTNLSRDHLDFHGDMENYFQAKKKLFVEYLKDDGHAVVLAWPEEESLADGLPVELNWGKRLVEELKRRAARQAAKSANVGKGSARDIGRLGAKNILECGARGGDVHPNKLHLHGKGIEVSVMTPQGPWQLSSPLVGEFNLKNILGAVGVGLALGFVPDAACRGLACLGQIPGRLERIATPVDGTFFVDYAHTPDALENVLQTLGKLKHHRLIVVFGCGGDRDRGKRSIMGQVAGRLADVVLVTSDNPRSE